MAIRSVLLCFAIIPLLVSSVIGEDLSNHVHAIEHNQETSSPGLNLVDFSDKAELANWEEKSDTVVSDGASKWDGVWYNTTAATGGLFFFASYPGSSSPYSGARKVGSWDLSSYKAIRIVFLAEGYPLKYRVVCKTNGLNEAADPAYDMRFTALNTTNWQRVTFPLDEFVPSVQGVIDDTLTFDTSKLSSVAILAIGGVGTSSVLIKEIQAV